MSSLTSWALCFLERPFSVFSPKRQPLLFFFPPLLRGGSPLKLSKTKFLSTKYDAYEFSLHICAKCSGVEDVAFSVQPTQWIPVPDIGKLIFLVSRAWPSFQISRKWTGFSRTTVLKWPQRSTSMIVGKSILLHGLPTPQGNGITGPEIHHDIFFALKAAQAVRLFGQGLHPSPLGVLVSWEAFVVPRNRGFHVAVGQNPNRTPSEHPNPTTKIGSKMGGEFTYPPKW